MRVDVCMSKKGRKKVRKDNVEGKKSFIFLVPDLIHRPDDEKIESNDSKHSKRRPDPGAW